MCDSNETVEFDEKIAELMPVLSQSQKGRCDNMCNVYRTNRWGHSHRLHTVSTIYIYIYM